MHNFKGRKKYLDSFNGKESLVVASGFSKTFMLLDLPAQELHRPPTPNSTSFSFGSVMQSIKSSKTLSC